MGAINGKVIYSPKGKAGEYAENAANFYVGCSQGCTYCYLRKGRGAKVLGGNTPELKKALRQPPFAIKIFEKELLKHKEELQKTGLFFSFTTDPLLPQTEQLTREAVAICQSNRVPVKILSKCANGINNFIYDTIYEAKWDLSLIALGCTLTGCDELEGNASRNIERVVSLRYAKDCGFRTFASIEPIPPGMSYRALHMINESFTFVDLFKIGLQSGCKYSKSEIFAFFLDVNAFFDTHEHNARVYWKESIIKSIGTCRLLLPDYCVSSKYNIFYDNEK